MTQIELYNQLITLEEAIISKTGKIRMMGSARWFIEQNWGLTIRIVSYSVPYDVTKTEYEIITDIPSYYAIKIMKVLHEKIKILAKVLAA